MSYWFSSKKESADVSETKVDQYAVLEQQNALLSEQNGKLEEQNGKLKEQNVSLIDTNKQLQDQLQKYENDSKQIQEFLSTIKTSVYTNHNKLKATITELEDKIKEYQNVKKVETILYYDGSLYQGYLQDHKPDGYGIMVHGNGTRYVGYWKDGLYHGSGVLYYPSMPPWYAEWDSHQPHGYCTYDGIHYILYVNGVHVE